MSYIGPIDKHNLEQLRELSTTLDHSQPVPRGSYRYLVDTLIGEWEDRGRRIKELETETDRLRGAIQELDALLRDFQAVYDDDEIPQLLECGARAALVVERVLSI